jgi:flagellar biosynthetic protein FlhB
MSERTEAPTHRRLQEARQEGQVARSIELNAAIALLMGAWLIGGPGKKLLSDLQTFIAGSLANLPDEAIPSTWLTQPLQGFGLQVLADVGLIVAGLLVTGVIVTVAQTGLLWAGKRISPDLNRLNPLNGLKRLFSAQGLVELLKALLKLLFVFVAAYNYLKGKVPELLSLTQTDFSSAIQTWAEIALALMMRVGQTYLLLALADYAYQRWQHQRGLKMTKEEVKEEYKRSEGDPFLKSRIRSQQRKFARIRMMANVPKADVVITNPTHLAIAIQYDQKSMAAPRVLAKGAHLVAERIVSLALSKSIPVVQNIPLARAIYRTVEIDQEIPPDLYMAMAEVLAYVYRMKGLTPQPAV